MVVFLDRDGVINKNSANYIKNWSEFEFLPGSLEAIVRLNLNGFTVIIITNQSMINRKLAPEKNLFYLHFMMKQTIEKNGGKIKDIFFCPHTPEQGCTCRKPQPGMINEAKIIYNITLADSVMVGDSAKDIECAQNAGCGKTVLVKTGNYNNALRTLSEKHISPTHITKDLYHAVSWIIEQHDKLRII